MIIQLIFNYEINDSVQVGDTVYYITTSTSANFKTGSTDSAIELGPITNINIGSTSKIFIDYDGSTIPTIPSTNTFIMFSKNNSVNLGGVIGYYAEVKFVNTSSVKSEIFNVSSVAQLNSK
tara:strand:+ start:278 stop:640 length:363 start_codon:yes stop_codon:yes gene_type:complete